LHLFLDRHQPVPVQESRMKGSARWNASGGGSRNRTGAHSGSRAGFVTGIHERPPRSRRKGSTGRGGHGKAGRRWIVAIAILLALAALFVAAALRGEDVKADSQAPLVVVVPIDGIIDPRMADFVIRGISEAEDTGARAVVLTIDTPGGLDESMRDIIKKMVNSPLPVIAYVNPSGARAASAGTFIIMASDVAAMAPGTNLGAAHPVAIGADPSTEEGTKILNDAAAYMRSLAEANGRNADWAELAVRQSISASADDALSQHVSEFTSDSVESLLVAVDGFKTTAKGITLDTGGVSIAEIHMSFWERLTHLLLNPNVVYLLLLLGLLAVVYELAHPGVGIGAVTGFLSLAVAIYALIVLPVNIAGLVLVILGFILLAADLYLPSYGTLTVAGVISLITGSWMLFDSSAPFLRVSWPLNIALALITTAFFIIIVRAAIKARRLPARTGGSAMIGETGYARSQLDPLGQVQVHGEIWSAESSEGETITRGEEIEIVEVRGLTLKVKRVP
jgi:membrane-bound serine protease (ClpP class)